MYYYNICCLAPLRVTEDIKIPFDFEDVKASSQQYKLPVICKEESVSDNRVDAVMYQHDYYANSAEQVEMKSFETSLKLAEITGLNTAASP